jgi:hypothetical protein
MVKTESRLPKKVAMALAELITAIKDTLDILVFAE